MGEYRMDAALRDASDRVKLQPCLATRDCFFFFQAEDGIRDIGVTGVQTCALPISLFVSETLAFLKTPELLVGIDMKPELQDDRSKMDQMLLHGIDFTIRSPPLCFGKIGRASCRERV